jgi:hypothetical protein
MFWEQMYMDQTCKRLWSAVLNQAIKDAQENHSVYARNARAWFCSKNQGTGSFIWICMILDLDPNAFQSVYKEREAVSYADIPQNMNTERAWAFGYKPQQLSNHPLT